MSDWYRTKTFKISFQIVLITIIFVAELHTGIFSNSTALVADSFHALSDVVSLCIGLIAVRTANNKPKPNSRKTFGNQRSEVLGGIVQAVFLYALCFHIYTESFKRFMKRQEQNDILRILVVGGIGLVANLTGLYMFCETGGDGHGHSHGGGHGHSHKITNDESEEQTEKHGSNLNTRGIWLHIMGDTLGSVSVMISSGVLMYYSKPGYNCLTSESTRSKWQHFPVSTGSCDDLETYWNSVNSTESCDSCVFNPFHPEYQVYSWLTLLDPALTFLIATIICASTYPLFRQSMHILMENCPLEIDFEEFRKSLEEGVKDFGEVSIQDLHIWQLNSEKGVATVRVRIVRPGKSGNVKDGENGENRENDGNNEISNYQALISYLTEELQSQNIQEITIQPEFTESLTTPSTTGVETTALLD